MAQTEGKGGRRIEEAQGKTGQAQGDQGRTRKEIESTKEGIKNCQIANCYVFPSLVNVPKHYLRKYSIKDQLISKSKLARRRFSQKLNGRI